MKLESESTETLQDKNTPHKPAIIMGAFLLAFGLMAYLFHGYTEEYAIGEAEKLVRDALLTHKAIHKYVNTESRPELYRLKSEGDLYEGYFSPKTMSFTYTARGIKSFLNEERKKVGLPEVYFKLATTNPRNEINQADTFESNLLKRMNAGELNEYKEITSNKDGEKSLYFSMATKPITKGCLKCHGDPADAPKEMVDQYPKASGYYEKEGDIRALISIRIPLEPYLEEGRAVWNALTAVTFVVLAIIYTLIYFFMKRSEQQNRVIVQQNNALELASMTDYLTGAYNRMGFIKFAEHDFDAARRYRKPFSLIMFDLDLFKQVNDESGHAVGDLVLQELSEIVLERIRGSDTFGRYGGEEFMIAVQEQGIQGASALAEELRAAVQHKVFTKGHKVTLSLGVAELTSEISLKELIDNADKALYEAKKMGRNRVVVYSPQPD
ncbi:MAG: diguanylate cyclase [Candidatus Thiodiazotropha taylori]|nr:diguanylate cyclase [Candidatus Thiodiazotropha taylori]